MRNLLYLESTEKTILGCKVPRLYFADRNVSSVWGEIWQIFCHVVAESEVALESQE